MRDYRTGRWGVTFIFSLDGSVLPRAIVCALPNAILAVGMWYIWRRIVSEKDFEIAQIGTSTGQVWTGYNWVLGFTVAFRAQRAYARWWEGGTLLQQARGEWFNAYSSLIAFCSQAEARREDVAKFQHILARLMSMLYASALMSVATEPDLDFEVIDATGMNEDHLDYLRSQPDKCEILMQWIQRLIVDNMGSGVLPIPPPVISRVFQELSRGIVNIHNVRKITEFQFPFPAAQMIVVMLIIQWALTPVATGLLLGSPAWAFLLSFFPIFACWGINYLAGELEQPFGTDYNDMPLHFMQTSMNSSIMALLDAEAQNPPDFDMRAKRLQSVMIEPGKVGLAYHDLSPMRSCRYLTISNHKQLNRVKHRFTVGRDHDERKMIRRSQMLRRGLTKDFKTASDTRDSTSSDTLNRNSKLDDERVNDMNLPLCQAQQLGRKHVRPRASTPVPLEGSRRSHQREHVQGVRRQGSTGSDLDLVVEDEVLEVISIPTAPPPGPLEGTYSAFPSEHNPGDRAKLRVAGRPNCDNDLVVEDHDVEVLPMPAGGTALPQGLNGDEGSAESGQRKSGSGKVAMAWPSSH